MVVVVFVVVVVVVGGGGCCRLLLVVIVAVVSVFPLFPLGDVAEHAADADVPFQGISDVPEAVPENLAAAEK